MEEIFRLKLQMFVQIMSRSDPPVAVRPALLLVPESLQEAASVQDGGVHRHVIHEREGGVQAHVALVVPVLPALPPPLLPLLPPLLLLVPRRCLSQVEALGWQRPGNNKSIRFPEVEEFHNLGHYLDISSFMGAKAILGRVAPASIVEDVVYNSLVLINLEQV